MTFEELKDAKYLLKVSEDGYESLSFELDIVAVKGNSLIAKAITVDGKAVSFESPNIKTEIWAVSLDNPPYTAKARCYFEKRNEERLLVVSGITNPVKMNKRAAYRVGLYLPCDVQLGISRPINAEIINGSDNGFAVKVKGDSSVQLLKDVIVVTFSDEDVVNNQLVLSGVCVRREDQEDGSIYGCRILESKGGFKSYLVKKQSRRCRN